MFKTTNILPFIICNFITLYFFSQGLQLSFSEHVSYESNYKAISCINYNSKHVLIQSKKKSENCDIKVNIFDSDLKNKNQFFANILSNFFSKFLLLSIDKSNH